MTPAHGPEEGAGTLRDFGSPEIEADWNAAWEGAAERTSNPNPDPGTLHARGVLINKHAATGLRLVELRASLPEVEKQARKTPRKDMLEERAKVEAARVRVPDIRREIATLEKEHAKQRSLLTELGHFGDPDSSEAPPANRPDEARCGSVLHSVATRVVRCENEAGHLGYHESGGYRWPQLPTEPRPNDAPGDDAHGGADGTVTTERGVCVWCLSPKMLPGRAHVHWGDNHITCYPSETLRRRLGAKNDPIREALTGLLSNIKLHHDGECPGIMPADCLDAIYESANIARAVLECTCPATPPDGDIAHEPGCVHAPRVDNPQADRVEYLERCAERQSAMIARMRTMLCATPDESVEDALRRFTPVPATDYPNAVGPRELAQKLYTAVHNADWRIVDEVRSVLDPADFGAPCTANAKATEK